MWPLQVAITEPMIADFLVRSAIIITVTNKVGNFYGKLFSLNHSILAKHLFLLYYSETWWMP